MGGDSADHKCYQDAVWLHQRFVVERVTKTEMALEAGVSRTAIAKWLIRAGVEKKPTDAPGSKTNKCSCSPRCPYWEGCIDWDDNTPCPRAGEFQMEGM